MDVTNYIKFKNIICNASVGKKYPDREQKEREGKSMKILTAKDQKSYGAIQRYVPVSGVIPSVFTSMRATPKSATFMDLSALIKRLSDFKSL